jgi:hypothetical protein
VLKLIYASSVFGPIDLEYDQPVIRVGNSEENDLVLMHPSIAPYHCTLVFRGETVLCLLPDVAIDSETELRNLAGPEFGAGDTLSIGDLQFTLAHSSRTVAVPERQNQDSKLVASDNGAATRTGKEPSQPRYYCTLCRAFVQPAEVKRVGLVGQAKHCLCPKCSRELEIRVDPEMAPSGHKKRSLRSWLPVV